MMSIATSSFPDVGTNPPASVSVASAGQPLHRLGAVRRREGISRRTIARRLKTSISDVKRHENETADLLLSTLYKWQQVLEVPVTELLVESNEPLSSPVRSRAKMLRVMKTAVTILDRARQTCIQRLAQMLVEQLVELMPELEGVGPWPAVGKSRQPSEYGQVVHRRLPDELFVESEDLD
jgi:transcriptional regulator with XRE-family HTH domain